MPVLSKESPILLVDDSVMMRQVLQNILSGLGYTTIDTAPNAAAAHDKIRDAKKHGKDFRILMLDWCMPGMDGLSFLKECRNDPTMADVAIIMVTSVSDQSSILSALENGATAYITKPFVPESVAEMIERVTEWSKEEEAQNG